MCLLSTHFCHYNHTIAISLWVERNYNRKFVCLSFYALLLSVNIFSFCNCFSHELNPKFFTTCPFVPFHSHALYVAHLKSKITSCSSSKVFIKSHLKLSCVSSLPLHTAIMTLPTPCSLFVLMFIWAHTLSRIWTEVHRPVHCWQILNSYNKSRSSHIWQFLTWRFVTLRFPDVNTLQLPDQQSILNILQNYFQSVKI